MLYQDHQSEFTMGGPPCFRIGFPVLCVFAWLRLASAQITPGTALTFDGVDDHVLVAPNDSLALSNQLTFEAWVYTAESRCNTIISRGPHGEDYIFQVGYDGAGDCTTRRLSLFTAGGWASTPTATIPLSTWTHVAVTFDGAFKRFYINGVTAGNVANSSALVQTASPLSIGRQGTASGCNCNFFKGRIDEVRIWNVVRSAAQINQNWNKPLAGNEPGLAAYYRFDESSGTTITDATGHGNTGTLNGARFVEPRGLGYWRMGESDPGAANGVTAVTAIDSMGLQNLTFAGHARYTSDVGLAASGNTDSSLSVNFSAAGAHARGSVVSSAQDSFGVEAWVKPASSVDGQILVYNGDTASNGWGIMINSNGYAGLYGGVTQFGSNAVTPNVWTHVALVRNRGIGTLYVNGTPAGVSSLLPNVPTGNFAVGIRPQDPASLSMIGGADEVRLFTFAPGQFTRNDFLLYLRAPGVTTGGATNLTLSSATISGTVNPKGLPTFAWFRFGTTTNYGSTTETFDVDSSSSNVTVEANLAWLTMATAYQYQLVASNNAGVTYGSNLTFTTLSPPLRPILQPSDPILAIDPDVASFSSYPTLEPPARVLDGASNTKYLNFAGRNSGFIVTPVTGPRIVRSMLLTTANDALPRDPTGYALYGTFDSISSTNNSDGQSENWTLIASGPLNLPTNRFAISGPYPIANTVAYPSYRLVFPTLKGGPEMQIADVGFFETVDASGPNILGVNDFILAVHLPTSQSRYPVIESPTNALDGITTTKYLNLGKENAGFIVTPAAGATVLKAFRFFTANDLPNRDPAAWAIYGTTEPIQSADNSTGTAENWTLIDQGITELPVARQAAGPLTLVANNGAYTSYRMVTPALRNGPAVNSVQYSEIQFYEFSAAIAIRQSAGNVVIDFIGALQSSTNVSGPYEDVNGATSPYQPGPGDLVGQKFYRARGL